MNKVPQVFLQHILESIELIEKRIKNVTYEEFINDVDLQDMVIRRLEIVGEAVKNLPADFKRKYPDIPWKKIAGLRDKLIHGYFGIDLKLVWEIVQNNLPLFKEQIEKFLQE